MLLECKNDPENFPLNEEEIHQTFTNLGFVLNWNKRFCKALEACEKDTTKFIDTLQQYLTLPEFGTVLYSLSYPIPSYPIPILFLSYPILFLSSPIPYLIFEYLLSHILYSLSYSLFYISYLIS
jgi:hypothetical protein